jgi:cephalosporin hydroxylase
MIEPNIYCKVSGMTMQCISLLNQEGCRLPTVIEIGCADGQGTMRYAGFTGLTICVDPMIGGRPDIISSAKEDMTPDAEKLASFWRRNSEFPVKLVQGCSLWPESIQEVEQILMEKKADLLVDILVVDGCHHPFEAVWGDFEAYYRFVRKGGYVVFDDLYEDCILQAYEKAISERNMEKVDRFYLPPHNLQEVAALRKTED